MNPNPTIILPGLDGTDLLLDSFSKRAPETHAVQVWSLPDIPTDDYYTLCDHFTERIRKLESCHIIAESFSGPLGILLAYRHPEIVKRLTLIATFAAPPAPFVAKLIPWALVFQVSMPSLIAKRFFVGREKSLVPNLRKAIRQTSKKTLVRRIHCLMKIDVTIELSKLYCELTYIRPIRDRLISKRCVNTITKANPRVSVHELDGPHLILQTCPELVWNIICGEKNESRV